MPTARRRFHNASIFGEGRRSRLDRNQKARFLWLTAADHRTGRISANGKLVAIELVKLLGDDGRLDPSHATITARVGCDVSTTRRCLDRLRNCGRIAWERRLRRDRGTGWRAEQTSNAYQLLPSGDCDTHSAIGVKSTKKRRNYTGSTTPDDLRLSATVSEIAAARAALGQIRQARTAGRFAEVGA